MGSTPVCSLQYVPRKEESSFKKSGLLVSQLDKLLFFESKQNEEYKCHPLLIEQNIMSCSFEPNTRSVMLSTRPTLKHLNVRHLTYEFEPIDNDEENPNIALNLIHTYSGGKTQQKLAKSRLFTYDSRLYGCASEEPSKCVIIWDVSNSIIKLLININKLYLVCYNLKR